MGYCTRCTVVGGPVQRRWARLWVAAIAGLGFTLGLPAGSSAAPTSESEPNDNLLQINGPINPEGVVGTLATGSDHDLFIVRLRPQRQVRLRFQVTNSNVCSLGTFGGRVYYDLALPSGAYLASGTMQFDDETTEESFVTTPGVFGGPTETLYLTFYAEREETAGCSYQFTVTAPDGGPTDAVDDAPLPSLPIIAVAEPNDLASQAFGPMVGNALYEGAIETTNDVDYLRVRLRGAQNARIELLSTGGVEASVLDGESELASQTESFIVPRTDDFLVRVMGILGARWRLRIIPATVVVPPPPLLSSAVKPSVLSLGSRGRRITARVRIPRAGRLVLVLAGRGRRVGMANIRASGERTVTITYTRPLRLMRGLYVLEARFTAIGARTGVVRRYVRL